jgi:CorA-like Mg2+ transporter protein
MTIDLEILMNIEKNDEEFELELISQYDLLLSLDCEEFSDLFKRTISCKIYLLSDIEKNKQKIFLLNQFLQELNNYNAILNTIETSRLNKKMTFLTLLTALFVPGTFFTSIFSMNIQIPFQNDMVMNYDAFIFVCLFLIVTFVLFFVYYRFFLNKKLKRNY